ncbi:MAG: DUF983 domain-containing protein [Henriciella sp.]
MYETPIKSGVLLKCGRCGKGKLFRQYLKFKDKCDVCDLDFTVADTADGPAFFVGSLMMILFAPFYFILPIVETTLIVKLALWAALIGAMTLFCLTLLPRFKGVLFNLQVRHRAEEAKFESHGTHGAPPDKWKY